MMHCIFPKLDGKISMKEGGEDSVEDSPVISLRDSVELRRMGWTSGMFNSVFIAIG